MLSQRVCCSGSQCTDLDSLRAPDAQERTLLLILNCARVKFTAAQFVWRSASFILTHESYYVCWGVFFISRCLGHLQRADELGSERILPFTMRNLTTCAGGKSCNATQMVLNPIKASEIF